MNKSFYFSLFSICVFGQALAMEMDFPKGYTSSDEEEKIPTFNPTIRASMQYPISSSMRERYGITDIPAVRILRRSGSYDVITENSGNTGELFKDIKEKIDDENALLREKMEQMRQELSARNTIELGIDETVTTPPTTRVVNYVRSTPRIPMTQLYSVANSQCNEEEFSPVYDSHGNTGALPYGRGVQVDENLDMVIGYQGGSYENPGLGVGGHSSSQQPKLPVITGPLIFGVIAGLGTATLAGRFGMQILPDIQVIRDIYPVAGMTITVDNIVEFCAKLAPEYVTKEFLEMTPEMRKELFDYVVKDFIPRKLIPGGDPAVVIQFTIKTAQEMMSEVIEKRCTIS